MKTKVLLLHGPNLNLLGTREPVRYGSRSAEQILADLREQFPYTEIGYFQSNDEGALVTRIQEAAGEYGGLLINAGGLSHSSVSIADAIRSSGLPAIGIHISNIYARESYRHSDIVGSACKGSIVGLGTGGYMLALECLLEHISSVG